jgi:predicted nucleotidyltransferase component of viral defense system
MSDDSDAEHYHQDEGRFRDALTRTASDTGFSARLIEKDYYCSVLLRDFANLFSQGLVFKGGTCLSKVHIDFFRLSEDLDFGVSVKQDASRAKRRGAIEPVKKHLPGVTGRLPFFTQAVPLTGHNNNTQYNAEFTYRSHVTGEPEAISVEVSLREEVLLPSAQLPAKTMLLDPFTGSAAVQPVAVHTLSLTEAYAEKTRAALTRREPAIRDFFDIDAAAQRGLVTHTASEFLDLVLRKLASTGDPVDTSKPRIEVLRRQIETQLKPVLRTVDFEGFALDRVVELLKEIASACQRSGR